MTTCDSCKAGESRSDLLGSRFTSKPFQVASVLPPRRSEHQPAALRVKVRTVFLRGRVITRVCRTSLFLTLSLLLLSNFGHAKGSDHSPNLPELPRILPQNFPPTIRDRIQKGYAAALANPRDALANGQLGMVLQAYSPTDERAEACYRRAHLLDPASFRWAYYLALVQAATGGCTTALPRLAEAFSHAADTTLRRLTGEALMSCVESNLKTEYPADADVLYQSARAHLRAWNDVVYQMFQKTPGSYRVNQISGEIFEIQGKYREAAAEYRKAIEKTPRALDLHFRLGRAILIDPQGPDALENARREFEAELALNNGDEVGRILIAQGKRDAGANHLQRALTLRPDFVEALLAVGRAQLEDKHFPEAISLLTRAVKLPPRSEPAHYSLMMAYRNSGDLEAAKREKAILDELRKPPEGEFTDFLKKLGEKPPKQ